MTLCPLVASAEEVGALECPGCLGTAAEIPAGSPWGLASLYWAGQGLCLHWGALELSSLLGLGEGWGHPPEAVAPSPAAASAPLQPHQEQRGGLFLPWELHGDLVFCLNGVV